MLKRFAYVLSTAALVAAVACSQSDPGVTMAVKSKLAADDTVEAYQIDVDTNDRVVTLSGTVETAAQRENAVMLARQTDGVRDVVNQITVNPAAAPSTGNLREEAEEAAREVREEAREAGQAAKEAGRDVGREAGQAADRAGAAASDVAVTAAVKSKLLADAAVSGLKIDVDTNDGVVALNGVVSTKAEADRAVSLARDTAGVTRVVNNLRVGR